MLFATTQHVILEARTALGKPHVGFDPIMRARRTGAAKTLADFGRRRLPSIQIHDSMTGKQDDQ